MSASTAPAIMDRSPPKTPFNPSLTRELESALAKRNVLTVRTRSRVLADLANAAAADEDKTMDRLRARSVAELIDSEKSYLRHLEILEKFFMTPLKDNAALLPHSDFVSIFGDIPSIIQVNKELLASLQKSSENIGKVFMTLSPYLKFYSTYAQDFQSSARLVERWSEKNKAFRQFVAGQESRPEVQLKLNALLITPVQRIPRYKMLLEDLIKNTPECHPDRDNLKESLAQIDAVAWHINEQLREHENALKMVDIQKSLQGGFPKIVVPGRKLVRQGNLMKVPRAGGTAQPRYFALFTDMLMYCKIKVHGVGTLVLPRPNALECSCMMPLKHTKVEQLMGKNVFKLTCRKEELILCSGDDEDGGGESWADLIARTIDQHKKDAATLRKESSRRDPLKRPEILKMRRDSLSQIMFNRNKRGGAASSPKKRPAPPTPVAAAGSPAASPCKQPKSAADENAPPVRKREARPVRPTWKTLSLGPRTETLRRQEAPSLFRSPSIYDQDPQAAGSSSLMSSYLSGKICPLTPSQEQTDVAHLAVQKELKEKLSSPAAAARAAPAASTTAVVPAAAANSGSLAPLVRVANSINNCYIM